MAARTRAKPTAAARKRPSRPVGKRRSGQSAWCDAARPADPPREHRRRADRAGAARGPVARAVHVGPRRRAQPLRRDVRAADLRLDRAAALRRLARHPRRAGTGSGPHWKPWAIGLARRAVPRRLLRLLPPGLDRSATSRSPSTPPAATSGSASPATRSACSSWLVIGVAAFALVVAGAARRGSCATRPSPRARRWALAPPAAHRATARGAAFEFIFPTRPAPQGLGEGADRLGDVGAHRRRRRRIDEEDEDEPSAGARAGAMFPERGRGRRRRTTGGVTVDEHGNRRSRDGWQLPAMDAARRQGAAGGRHGRQRAARRR